MLYSMITNMIKRSAVTRINAGDADTTVFPGGQVEYYGSSADTEFIWPYGMGANPPIGSYCVTYNIAGQEENRASIATAPDKRDKKLKEGECYFRNLLTGTGFINKANGDYELVVKNDHIELISGDKHVSIDQDLNVTVTGNVTLNVSGSVNINSSNINLGAGGAAIARLGDSVQVNTTTGAGTITSGSTQNTSA